MSNSDQDINSWHLDRRIPIALILTIMGGFVAAISWSNHTNARLAAVERLVLVTPSISDRLTRLETQNDAVLKSLTRIEQNIDRNDR